VLRLAGPDDKKVAEALHQHNKDKEALLNYFLHGQPFIGESRAVPLVLLHNR
jgi:hypothetical protein